jgi:DNA-binding IscR family transcriptional regulator
MSLAREASQINLLDIVEACQGLMIGSYCKSIGDQIGPVCGFHRAMWDVRTATRDALQRWNLEDLAETPHPTGELAGNKECLMNFLNGLKS